MQKYMQLKLLLLSLLIATSTIQPSMMELRINNFHKELISSISCDNFSSFIKEHPLFLFWGASLGLASYYWYKCKYSSMPIDLTPIDLTPTSLITTAKSLLKSGISFLRLTQKEIELLKIEAERLSDKPILYAIGNIETYQFFKPQAPSIELFMTPDVLKIFMPHLLAYKKDSTTSLYRDIMTISIASKSKKGPISRDKFNQRHPYRFGDRNFFTESHCIILKYHDSEKPWSLTGDKRSSRGAHSTEIYTKDRSQLLKTISNGICCGSYNPYGDTIIFLPQTNSCILHETDKKQTEIAKWIDSQWSNQDKSDYANASRWLLYDFNTQEQFELPINHESLPILSPNQQYIAYTENKAIYLLNITNHHNIKKIKFLDNVSVFNFNDNSTQLATVFGGTIELWNLEYMDWDSQHPTPIKTIINHNITSCCDVQFHDKTHLMINNSTRRFMHELLLIDIESPLNIYRFPEFYTKSNQNRSSIYHTDQKKSNRMSDYLGFIADKNPTDKFQLFSDKGRKLYSQLITHYYSESSSTQNIDLLFSENREWCATIYPFSLLQKQSDGTFIECIPVNKTSRILQLNNDGSFVLQTNDAIKFYNRERECETIIECHHNGKQPYKTKLKNQHIVCSYHSSKGSRFGTPTEPAYQISWQLPSLQQKKSISTIVDNLIPLQYLFIRDICTQQKKLYKEQPNIPSTFSLRPNSLHEQFFKSFTPNDQETLKEALKIKVC